jgi:hypothetical protein
MGIHALPRAPQIHVAVVCMERHKYTTNRNALLVLHAQLQRALKAVFLANIRTCNARAGSINTNATPGMQKANSLKIPY